jgi:sugar (pentulose or hexulose) kinase
METFGFSVDTNTLYTTMFRKALEGDPDSGDLLSYNYYSGEGVTGFDEGRLLFLRRPDSAFNLANFMKTHFFSSLATLKIGMDILTNDEGVVVDNINGHGGFFKTPEVGQRFLSAAIDADVSVMETAGEGGPYGMALLCAYALWKNDGETLEDYLDSKVFRDVRKTTVRATEEEVESFNRFLERYRKGLEIERTAIERF